MKPYLMICTGVILFALFFTACQQNREESAQHSGATEVPSSTQTTAPTTDFSGTYDSFTYSDETGDLGGTLLILARNDDGSYRARVAIAEGELGDTVNASSVIVSGDSISVVLQRTAVDIDGNPVRTDSDTIRGIFRDSLIISSWFDNRPDTLIKQSPSTYKN